MIDTSSKAPRLVHLTTTAISLDWLLGPQLDAFAEAGYDLTTVSAPGPHVDAVLERGHRHISIPSLSRAMDLSSDRQAWSELRDVFESIRPHIVHTHNPKPGVLGRILARRCNVPIVVNTVHGLFAQPTDSLAKRAAVYGAERLAAAFSDGELVQNVEDVELLRSLGVPASRVHLLGNGIDLDRFSPSTTKSRMARAHRRKLGIAPSTTVIGMVGRLVWEKGYREFFAAVDTLLDEDRDVAVVVIGPTEPGKAGAVDQETIDAMTARGVRFLGSRTDVDVLLGLFDIFVLPSHREGFPRSAMEASAMGVPVVSTDVRGCRQVVDHETTGLLVEPRSPMALASAIRTLLDDPLRRVAMGRAARARAAVEFDQQRVIARTLGLYRSLLDDAGIDQPRPVIDRYVASIDLVATAASKSTAEAAAA